MLRLPRPDIGINTGCNLAVCSTLCNILSGISTTIYKPAHLLTQARSSLGSGNAFKSLIRDFFPHVPTGAANLPRQLYEYTRNPHAHSLGLGDNVWQVVYGRVVAPSNTGCGWTDAELDALESSTHTITHPSISITGQQWTIFGDGFYCDDACCSGA